ncbi:MAG: TIGR02921 family PEP-CTERM protein [Chloroflexota bacterium]
MTGQSRTMQSLFSRERLMRGLGYGLFWSWNLIFAAFMLFGFLPIVLIDLLRAVRDGIIPTPILFFGSTIAFIPLVAMVIGGTILRRSPKKLLALGYGVQGPLMLLLMLRFFAFQELNPALLTFYGIAGVGLLTLLWQLLDSKIDERNSLLTGYLRLIGLTLTLCLGVYASIWLLFYVIPLAVEIIKGVGSFIVELPQIIADMWRYPPVNFDNRALRAVEVLMSLIMIIPWLLLGSVMFLYSATLIAGMPIAVPIVYWTQWREAATTFAQKRGMILTGTIAATTLIAALVLMGIAIRQPQHRAFALLESPPTSLVEAQAILDEEEVIRTGLLNAYLSQYRYISAVGEVLHIREMYEEILGFSPQQSLWVQTAYEWIARPILYTPVEVVRELEPVDAVSRRWSPSVMVLESEQAAELYETVFDVPINDGEREAVVNAVRTTWEAPRAQAAWQAVDDREIHLIHQEVTVTEHGDWADIELYEIYENQTFVNEEVVYYFSLPESAVVTGVWLGESGDRDKRYVYRVSPRGAAQELYRNEVRRNQDPALVEQIGPRQYRLRVFPILGRGRFIPWDDFPRGPEGFLDDSPEMHMWLTVRVLAKQTANGAENDAVWPLPRFAELRNVYWDHKTVRLLNGEEMTLDNETWLPDTLPATNPATPATHRIDFAGGQSVLVQPANIDNLPLAENLHLAVVLDRSYSMTEFDTAVQTDLEQLAELPNADIDLYLSASPIRGEEPSLVKFNEFNRSEIVYFGGQNATELLTQFDELYTAQNTQPTYDAVFVLTDGTGYQLGKIDGNVPTPPAPLWMIHVGGNFPLGYDDATLEAIQASGGGVTGSTHDALIRLTLSLNNTTMNNTGNAGSSDLIDGYAWTTLPTAEVTISEDNVIQHEATNGFRSLAGRRLILAEMQAVHHQLDDLTILDQLHDIAIENSIVTPYSSMIVIVNQRQQELLDQLEQAADRFDREQEGVGDTLPENAVVDVTGVPEPEEWLLIILATAVLGWYVYRKHRELRPRLM